MDTAKQEVIRLLRVYTPVMHCLIKLGREEDREIWS